MPFGFICKNNRQNDYFLLRVKRRSSVSLAGAPSLVRVPSLVPVHTRVPSKTEACRRSLFVHRATCGGAGRQFWGRSWTTCGNVWWPCERGCGYAVRQWRMAPIQPRSQNPGWVRREPPEPQGGNSWVRLCDARREYTGWVRSVECRSGPIRVWRYTSCWTPLSLGGLVLKAGVE